MEIKLFKDEGIYQGGILQSFIYFQEDNFPIYHTQIGVVMCNILLMSELKFNVFFCVIHCYIECVFENFQIFKLFHYVRQSFPMVFHISLLSYYNFCLFNNFKMYFLIILIILVKCNLVDIVTFIKFTRYDIYYNTIRLHTAQLSLRYIRVSTYLICGQNGRI